MSSTLESLYARLPVFAQSWACSLEGWRRARARFTPHFHRVLAEWEQSVHGPRERLLEIQWRRLRRLVERARTTTAHYRDLPAPSAAGDPEEALTRTLAMIPVLEKSEYRADPGAFLCRDLPPQRLIRGKTSGTTGSALPLWWTPEALAEEFASFWRQRRACGVALGEPNLTFNGQTIVPFGVTRPPFWRRNHVGGQTLFSLYHMSPRFLPAYVDGIHASPATWVQGYPSSIFLAARALLDAGRPVPKGRLKAVFTSSESLLAFQRETIEAGFGAPVRDRYGVSEFCVSMTECAQQKLHVDMEFGIVETVVQERGEDWERGELLVTGLSSDATPFLRYRVGDVGTRWLRPCPCGRPGDVFLDVDGRVEDYVLTPDGRLVGRLDHIFKAQHDVGEAQILQEDPGAIEVRVVRRPSWSEGSERALLKEIHSRLGEELRVELRYVDAIPREANGKFRAVKSKPGAAESLARRPS